MSKETNHMLGITWINVISIQVLNNLTPINF